MQTKLQGIIQPQKVPEKRNQKIEGPSFLQNFETLTEDDLDILATFEEEQARIG